MSEKRGFNYPLYLVLSEAACKGRTIQYVAEQAILGGVDMIQLREKNDSLELFRRKALDLMELTTNYQVPLIINDRLAIAVAVDADGIHVGNNDMAPTKIRKRWKREKYIGYSIEFIEQLGGEEIAAADYLGISPVFRTPTKTDTVTEWGLEGVTRIRQLTDKPLVAIGNINKKNAKAILEAGADGVAVVSAICGAEQIQRAAYELKNELVK